MRPVILLNTRAVEASDEAEAIIAHELAHVARMDWVKLLLARVATALFWFNPLVWMLAREAHQLREEAADDAVLAADIADTDYAQLLVGVARHECPGLLLGAHGVAPSKSSLARRVARVLDGKSVRGPVARSFAAGVFVGAVLIAAPLAALTLTPASVKAPSSASSPKLAGGLKAQALEPYYPQKPEVPMDLPSLIASGVSTAVTAVAPPKVDDAQQARTAAIAEAVASATKARDVALVQASQAAAHARTVAHAQGRDIDDERIQRAIEMKTVGVTPDYVNAMIAAAPQLGRLDPSDFVGMRTVGVTPDFAREWNAAGFRLDDDQFTQARAVGVRGSYVRAMMAAGVRASFDDYVQLWTVGVRPDYVQRLHGAGYNFRNADKLVEMFVLGIGPEDLKGVRVGPPRPPPPPAPPRDPDEDHDDG
jgi:hypothetical protein